ncbi:hypothetical protein BD410DRAFT_796488 [Rickenella mellea]|uniref:Mixed lineage kinase domain-containing protein n=1 Tax=Rickenella mellea TaxID=50990 RepID=A0A4Y7PK10_9AGAM|nr:hypothetical protein BD410DRAFT_796488 [Rickenella mellea]
MPSRFQFLPRRSQDASTKPTIDQKNAATPVEREFSPIALSALRGSAEVLPSLKAAVEFLLQIHDRCEKIKGNRDYANDLRTPIDRLRESMVDAFNDEKDAESEMRDALEYFDTTCAKFLRTLESIPPQKNGVSRMMNTARDAELLSTVNRHLDETTKSFMLVVTVLQTDALRKLSLSTPTNAPDITPEGGTSESG